MTETELGRVVRADARVYHVEVRGEVRLFAAAGKLFEDRERQTKNPIAVGDQVRVRLDSEQPYIEEVLPRRNSLSRITSSHDPREQILCANVDQLFVIASLAQPGFSSNRADRMLAACRYEEIPAHLVLNKTDLADPPEIEEIAQTYLAAGVTVHRTCATAGEGLDVLRSLLADKTSVFYGGSGTGKSTILNALQPDLRLKVGKISKYWDAGKHTTSFSQLWRLPAANGWVVDTPGVRVFRLYGINKAELRDLFPEFGPFQPRCRFPSCSHDHEPDCAVFQAVEDGEIAPTRYASYVEILDELVPPPEDDGSMVAPPEG